MSVEQNSLPNISSNWTGSRHGWATVAIFGLYLFLSFYHLADIPLIDPDEPRYAASGRTMYEGGSWLIPEFNGEKRINKPPLFYWLVAISAHLYGGSDELSARLPSIAMGFLLVAMTIAFGRLVYSPSVAYLGALILCTTPIFFTLCRTCIIDQTLATLISGGAMCLCLGIVGRWPWRCERFYAKPVFWAGLFLGLAFLSKGPAALNILLMPLAFIVLCYPWGILQGVGRFWGLLWVGLGLLLLSIHYLFYRDAGQPIPYFLVYGLSALVVALFSSIYYGLREFWKDQPWVIALFLALILSTFWFFYLMYDVGLERFQKLVAFEVVGRLKGAVHKQGYAFYFYVVLGVFFPWSIGALGAFGRSYHLIRTPLPFKSALSSPPDERTKQVADSFLFCWFLTIFAFFSIPSAKLPSYILPAMPAAALMVARYLMLLGERDRPMREGWRITTMIVALFMIQTLIVMGIGPYEEPRERRNKIYTVQEILILLGVLSMFVSAAIFAVKWLLKFRKTTNEGQPAYRWLLFSIVAIVGSGLLGAYALIPNRVIEYPNRWQGIINDIDPYVPLWGKAILLILFCCVPWLLACIRRRAIAPALSLAAFIFIAVTAGMHVALQTMDRRSNKSVAEEFQKHLKPGMKFYSVGCREESLTYYLNAVVLEARSPDRQNNETHLDIVKETMAQGEPGTVAMFVHSRYYKRWLGDTVPVGARRIPINSSHIVVLINEPEAQVVNISAVTYGL